MNKYLISITLFLLAATFGAKAMTMEQAGATVIKLPAGEVLKRRFNAGGLDFFIQKTGNSGMLEFLAGRELTVSQLSSIMSNWVTVFDTKCRYGGIELSQCALLESPTYYNLQHNAMKILVQDNVEVFEFLVRLIEQAPAEANQ